jgi:hypothetical protein
MAVTITPYTSYKQYVHDGTIDLDAANIYLALVLDTYTFSAAHTIWSQVSTYEAATGNGYTTGGAQIASRSVNATRFDAADLTFTALTKVFKYGVIYVNATVNSIVKPLIACILFDDTPGNITVSGVDLVVIWNASGIITF